MTGISRELEAELYNLLAQLAHFYQEHVTDLCSQKCEDCFQRLSDHDKSALQNLAEHLIPGQRKSKNVPSRRGDQVSEVSTLESMAGSPFEPTSDNPDHDRDVLGNSVSILRQTHFASVKITLSSPVNAVLVRCIEEPDHFFAEVHRGSHPTSGGLPEAFYDLYTDDLTRDLLQIYRRFRLLNLFSLVISLGYHNGKKWEWNATEDLSAEIVARCSSPGRPLEKAQVRKDLKHYVELARGYKRWVEHFGDPAYLIALPLHDVTETE